MTRGLPWEFGRNLNVNIFSRKLACIRKKTSPKRWDYFRTKITTFSRSNLRKTSFFYSFIKSFSYASIRHGFVHISCEFRPSTLGIWRNLTWPDLGTTLKPRLKMWSDSRFCNYNSIDLKWVLFEIISSTDIHDTKINQILLRKKIKLTSNREPAQPRG